MLVIKKNAPVSSAVDDYQEVYPIRLIEEYEQI